MSIDDPGVIPTSPLDKYLARPKGNQGDPEDGNTDNHGVALKRELSRTPRTVARLRQLAREYRAVQIATDKSQRAEKEAKNRLIEEQTAADSHRHLPLPIALAGILIAAVLEIGAAEPGAESLGFGILLTYVVTVIFVVAVVVGAIMLAHARGERLRFLLACQIVVLFVLFGLRLVYLRAFVPLLDAVIAAAGLSLATAIIYLITEELARRAEPVTLWQAEHALRKAARERRRNESKALRAHLEHQKAVDAHEVSNPPESDR